MKAENSLVIEFYQKDLGKEDRGLLKDHPREWFADLAPDAKRVEWVPSLNLVKGDCLLIAYEFSSPGELSSFLSQLRNYIPDDAISTRDQSFYDKNCAG